MEKRHECEQQIGCCINSRCYASCRVRKAIGMQGIKEPVNGSLWVIFLIISFPKCSFSHLRKSLCLDQCFVHFLYFLSSFKNILRTLLFVGCLPMDMGFDYISSPLLLPVSLWFLLCVFSCRRSFLVGSHLFQRWLSTDSSNFGVLTKGAKFRVFLLCHLSHSLTSVSIPPANSAPLPKFRKA